jgi:ABC-type uncharacterized transport system involved in gliding motility auxiliary subunit
MDIIKKYLNYIGIGLIFFAFIGLKIWPYKKTIPLVLAILGISALIIYIVSNLSILKQSIKRKTFLYSSNLLLMIVIVLGILVLVNYFFSRNHHRFDFTEAKLHSLSDQSITVLKGLKEDIQIKCFFREGNFNRGKMENLLQIYSYHSNKIKYEFIDPDKNPGMVKRYEITEDGTTILESKDKDGRFTAVNEEDITNAVIKISREQKKVIYFLEGHGEGSIEDLEDRGYSLAKDELEKQGYEIQKLSLALADNFPKDLALLIVPGPKKDLLPNELDTIQDYIQNGGRVFFMIDPETSPGMKAYFQEYGIKLVDDLVIDTVSRLLGGDYFMPVVNEYESHVITNKFRYATFFPYARSVEIAESLPEGITADILAKSSGNSWSERQLTEQEVKFDKDKDKAGPISLAVVVTIKPNDMDAPSEEKPEGRIAVFGDSDFISNSYYHLSGNGNFFLNTANWLTEEADLISIQPKTQSPRTIQLSPSQGKLIFFVSVILLPLIVMITGIFIWTRRRSL